MAELQKSQDYGTAVIKEFNDAQLSERVKSLRFMGPTVSRLRLAYFSISHGQAIYGQMAVYLRLNRVMPPASNRGGGELSVLPDLLSWVRAGLRLQCQPQPPHST